MINLQFPFVCISVKESLNNNAVHSWALGDFVFHEFRALKN